MQPTSAQRRGRARAERAVELAGDPRILRSATAACEHEGLPGREQQVAYLLAAHLAKDPDDDLADDHIAAEASWIAANLREWGALYESVVEEFERRETHTLAALARSLPLRGAPDVIETITLCYLEILGRAPRLDQLSLERLRRRPPSGSQYLFTGAFPGWVARVIHERRSPETVPFEVDHPAIRKALKLQGEPLRPDVVVAQGGAALEEWLDGLQRRLSSLATTRELVASLIEGVERLDAALAAAAAPTTESAAALARLRARLGDEIDALRRERRALPDVLSYLALSLPRGSKQQGVGVLSLRMEAIDPVAAETLAARLRSILDDPAHPGALLVIRAERAVERREIIEDRAQALAELRDTRADRAVILRRVRELIDRLPPSVADDGAIASLLAISTAGTVQSHRRKVRVELESLNKLYGQVFARYGDRSRP